jgi:hypothetical protein
MTSLPRPLLRAPIECKSVPFSAKQVQLCMLVSWLMSVKVHNVCVLYPEREGTRSYPALRVASVAHESVRRGVEPDLCSVSPGRVQTLQ